MKQEINNYLRGRRNIESTIWVWIVLELWLRMFIDQ
jgi:hypothetical protein